MTVLRCGSALLPVPDGTVTVSGPVDITCTDGLITAIGPQDPAVIADEVLPGLVTPSFADAHSHVFHRALRGRTHAAVEGPGDFWTWRDAMYAVASRLDPDSLHTLARAAYTEMICAGVTAVGEFHYLHHAPDGQHYADPNAMGLAVIAAAETVGIAATLIDVAYLAGGISADRRPEPLNEVQQRFGDGSIQRWAERVSALPLQVRRAVAIHSVRAVPAADMPTVVEAAGDGWLHVHLSEQPAENAATMAAYGLTPTQVLARAGALGPRTAAVHATHLTETDIALLGGSGTAVVMCPATEADLADGIGRADELAAAGSPIALGSDQHVITDPLHQARGLEYGERLAGGHRGRFGPDRLWQAATVDSHRVIGSAAGRLEVGAPADLVALRTDSARTAGSLPEQLIMSASAADVAVVVVAGRVVARDGVHLQLGDPGALLTAALKGLVE